MVVAALCCGDAFLQQGQKSCSELIERRIEGNAGQSLVITILRVQKIQCAFLYLFRQFVDTCGHALGVNERLIKEDQQEYHDEMKANYRNMIRDLSNIMHEQ
ncbi:hypothetical protein ATANTOWER_007154, partial [Ataeniobius toweri]|nr:hypothetical protein [Ataeniobius toweri]